MRRVFTRSWLVLFGLALCLLADSYSCRLNAQPAVNVTGDCNVTVVTTGSGTSKVDLTGQVCNSGDDPRVALRVMYHWLDPVSMSFLLASRIEASLQTILGQSPIILPTKALADAKELVDRFGSRVDAKPSLIRDYINIRVESGSGAADIKTIEKQKVPKEFLRGVKMYDAIDSIFIPDIEAYKTLKDPDRWPRGYSIFYCAAEGNASEWTDRDIISDMYLWRNATRDDLLNYKSKIGTFVNQAIARQIAVLPPDLTDYESFVAIHKSDRGFAEEQREGARRWATGKAADAMLFVGRASWPQDFLTIFAARSGCGTEQFAWDFTVYPREPFLQIAVLENTSTRTPIPLSAIRVQEAGDAALREPDSETGWTQASVPFPPSVLRPGEKLVIPLRIDFRQHRDARSYIFERYRPEQSEKMAQFVRGRSSPVAVTAVDGHKVRFTKKPSAFTPPVDPKIRMSYTYGRRLSLVSAVSGNTEIPLRPFDSTRIFMVAGYETGSCPFLYARYRDDPDPLKIGRVFRLASDPKNPARYERTFDGSLEELVIAEEEAEVTKIQRLTLIARKEDGAIADEMTVSDITLSYGEAISIRPRISTGVHHYTLVTEGYYIPISAMLAGAALQ